MALRGNSEALHLETAKLHLELSAALKASWTCHICPQPPPACFGLRIILEPFVTPADTSVPVSRDIA